MLRIPADEGEEDPWGEERRFGVPALLRKISPGRNAAGHEQEEQSGGEASMPVHSDNKLKIIKKREIDIYVSGCYVRVVALLCGFITERQNLCSSSWCDNTAKLRFKGVGSAAILKGMA